MEKEGQKAEQPVAPAPPADADKAAGINNNATPDTTAPVPVGQPTNATAETPVEQPAPTPAEGITNATDTSTTNVVNPADTTSTTGSANTATPRSRMDKKRIGIIAGIAAAAFLLIIGIAALLVNLVNNNTNEGYANVEIISNENVEQSERGKELEAQAEQLATNSSIDSMITYIDNIIDSYENGTNYQDLTQGDIGILCTKGIESIYGYISKNQDKMYDYGGTILDYAYTEESMVHTADSAVDIYFAENYYGTPEKAEEYKKIAIERGSKIWEINGEKEE